MFAAQEEHENVVEILIERGADINIDNNVSVCNHSVSDYLDSTSSMFTVWFHCSNGCHIPQICCCSGCAV